MTKVEIMRLANQLIEQLLVQDDDDFVDKVSNAVCTAEEFSEDDIKYVSEKM